MRRRGGLVRIVGLTAAVLAVIGVAPAPASAADPTVQVTFSPSTGLPGTTFAITGACINDGAPATIAEMDVYSADSNEEQFPNLTVAPDGTFTGSVTLSTAGRYLVTTICRRSAMDGLGTSQQILRVEDPADPLPVSVVAVYATPAGSPSDRMRIAGRCLVEEAPADSATITLSRPALADGSPRFEETVVGDIEIDGQFSAEPIALPTPQDGRYTATLSCVRDGAVVASAVDEVLVGEDVPVAPTETSTTSTPSGSSTTAVSGGAAPGAAPASAVTGSPSYTG